ncbi:MAG: ABC transporter permease [Ruminococcus sp.]|uniref:ABC transporter permease n=1 Tax=Schaedlerella arabinosiphila TaxID=2044587 RepID=A0A3R8LWJ5_9FIRM|nr:ABC transporter permease [Schaedlerella arabinosiphila]MCI8722109.1 ABC transporter permease [Ruminococcus sp.]MCI9213419.1 ABC transporter permease [Ruminococcus sp.]RRK30891.1 ABC transporter permease [Schaedlerella arabinosiphila]
MKNPKNISELVKSLAAILLALLIGACFILISGESPLIAYGALIEGALGSPQALANTVSKSIPLAFTGLAVALGSRCGMLNIGAEGQLHAGAMASVLFALWFSFLPAPLLLAVSITAGIGAGMLVGCVPGIFKAKFNTSEVIVAIMLNYICTLFTSWLVNGPYKVEGSTAQTELIPESIWFGRLLPRTQLTYALLLLILTAVLMYIFLWKTSAGFKLRAVGANPNASRTAGIKVNMYLITSMLLSGGIAALAGVTEVFGKYHRFIEGFSPSFGFTGIAVAILGRNHPAGVMLTAFLFGIMDMGSLRMSRETMVSTNMVTVVQSLVILFVAAPELIKWQKQSRAKQH